MNPYQGTELRSGRVINSSSETSSPIDPDMAQSSANDSDNNETSDISSQLSEIRENYEKKINELQSEFSQLKNLLMAVISKNDENNLPSSSQSSSKPTHRVGLDTRPPCNMGKKSLLSLQQTPISVRAVLILFSRGDEIPNRTIVHLGLNSLLVNIQHH